MATNTNVTYLGSQLVLLNGLPMVLASASADPGSATNGSLYYNSTSNVNRQYINGAWADIGAGSVTSVAATVPGFLSISGSPITSSGTLAISYSGTALPIANGGTAGTSASAAFNNLSPLTTTGDIIYASGASTAARLAIGTAGQVLTVSGGIPAWGSAASGTVTSVALADASTTPIYSVSGSPVTSSGTLTLTLATQSANTVFAGATSGGAAQPTFRSLVAADIPSLSATYELVSNFAVRSYNNSITLAANTSSPTTIAAFTFAFGTYGSMKCDYVMIEASTSSRRQGTFRVCTDGTNTGMDDTYAQTATLGNGIVLSAAVSGSNVIVQFTGTNANAVTMRAQITQFVA